MNSKVILILILLVAGGMIYYVSLQENQGAQETIKETVTDDEDDKIMPVDELKTDTRALGVDNVSISGVCISDWKTYRNEEYGYEICFPKTWAVSEDGVTVAIQDTAKKTEEVYDAENYPILYITPESTNSFDDWIMNNVPEIDAGMVAFDEIGDIEINNIHGKELPRIIAIGGCERSVALFQKGVVFNIFRYGGTCQYDTETINDVISSFTLYK